MLRENTTRSEKMKEMLNLQNINEPSPTPTHGVQRTVPKNSTKNNTKTKTKKLAIPEKITQTHIIQ